MERPLQVRDEARQSCTQGEAPCKWLFVWKPGKKSAGVCACEAPLKGFRWGAGGLGLADFRSDGAPLGTQRPSHRSCTEKLFQKFFSLLSGPCQDHGEFGRRHMASTLWCLYSLAAGDVVPGLQMLGVYPWALDKVLPSLKFCILLAHPLLDLLKPWKIFS